MTPQYHLLLLAKVITFLDLLERLEEAAAQGHYLLLRGLLKESQCLSL
jgi:hypothetical protein